MKNSASAPSLISTTQDYTAHLELARTLIDGILLHQMLQWHHLISSWVSPNTLKGLQTNTFWDGAFNLAMWLILVAAVFGVRQGAQL